MEGTSRALEPVIIGQDEGSELHVQPVVQSGRRQIDIRLWRRGPSGFAPSRNALTVEAPDLAALSDGISELLLASNDAHDVARVVWDRDESRRLRAETEPFGTRFMARLGFWQRVRDTWRPADDGLVIAAELLRPLLEVLDGLRARFLEAAESDLLNPVVSFDPEHEKRWPSPGADWITLDPDRIAFHPRGVRITVTVASDGDAHHLLVQQWRRDDSIWLPTRDPLGLSLESVDGLLSRLRHEPLDETPVERSDGNPLRLRMEGVGDSAALELEEMRDGSGTPRLSIPAAYAGRMGRLLAQCGALLLMQLSPAERDELLAQPEGPVVSSEIVDDALVIVEPEPVPEIEPLQPAAQVEASEGGNGHPDPECGPTEPERRSAQLAEVHLGQQEVTLHVYLLADEPLYMAMHWPGGSLAVPMVHVPRMLEDLRNLYYDALRGRRGHISTVPGSPATHMSIHSHGAGIYVMLDQESADRMVSLLFPVRELPAFLNSADRVLQRVRRSDF